MWRERPSETEMFVNMAAKAQAGQYDLNAVGDTDGDDGADIDISDARIASSEEEWLMMEAQEAAAAKAQGRSTADDAAPASGDDAIPMPAVAEKKKPRRRSAPAAADAKSPRGATQNN
jgi:hypothetical protein